MSELKPCPFCGEIPIVEVIARFPRSGKDEGKRIKGYTVVCQNLDCILHNADNWYQRSGKKACEAWNHRAEPENRLLTLEEIIEKLEDEEWNVVWMECPEQRVTVPMCPQYREGDTIICCAPLTQCKGKLSNYGKTWRCWPRKPTPEQMAAEKWEDRG